MTVTVVVGNPRPGSRTLGAARLVAERLTGAPPDRTFDLATFGADLLDWDAAPVKEAVATVKVSRLLVVASPTYKGAYTGVLKLFLDRFGAGSLAGVTAIPVMLGGDLRHSLAPEAFLKPVLNEIGASTPTAGLFLPEAEHEGGPTLDAWLDAARRHLSAPRLAYPDPAPS